MSVDVVVFDIGRVLIEWDPQAMYDARIGAERRERLFAEVDLDGMNLGVDRGDDLDAAVEALAARHPDWAAEIRMWRDNWLEMVPGPIEGSVALLRGLRARGVPVFALSNFGNATFAIAERVYPFLTEFDGRFISGALGVIKPDPEIYRLAEDGIGAAPGRLFFIDDKPENIAAAEARGWQGHVFDGPAGLAARLKALGLLPA